VVRYGKCVDNEILEEPLACRADARLPEEEAGLSISFVAELPRIAERDGALRVGGTRVTLETVLWAHAQGSIPEEIQRQFPSLELADVYGVIAYYLRRRESIDEYLHAQEQAYRSTAEEVKRAFPQADFRERLLSRLEQ
jgi:uncharacterized protein (DUF433 family)